MSADSVDRNRSALDDDLQVRPQEMQSPSSVSETGNVINRDNCENRTLSWHEHVYRKLTAKPTPHYIENILGLQDKAAGEPQEYKGRMADGPGVEHPHPKMTSSVPELNEPLNLSIRSDLKIRAKTVKGG